MNSVIQIHLILIDDETRQVWRTPKHNKNRKKDDYHKEIKQIIKKDLPHKLKAKFGKNCNIEIRNDGIWIVSQIYNEETGQRANNRISTGLKPENYFDKVGKYMLFVLLNELDFSDYDCIIIKIDRVNNSLYYIIELKVRNVDEKPEGF